MLSAAKNEAHACRAVVVIAGSAGAVTELQTLVPDLPADLPAAVVIVQHRSPHARSVLAEILQRLTPMPTKVLDEGERLREGVIYVAPPDAHVAITPELTFRLTRGAPVHFVASSADPLFSSAASVFGRHVVGIVLTGGNGDGTEGARAVTAAGGVTIAQDPHTALAPGMPESAIAAGVVRHVMNVGAMGGYVADVTRTWAAAGG